MRISISSDELNRIKKQKRINNYANNIKISKDENDPYTFWITSSKDQFREYMVYFSLNREKWFCDCWYYAFHPDSEKTCIHIATVKYYNRFLEYLKSVKDEPKVSQQLRKVVLQEHAEIKD